MIIRFTSPYDKDTETQGEENTTSATSYTWVTWVTTMTPPQSRQHFIKSKINN
jgi:hypothetical protein